jgi:4'-phosphopantetheinyl transferase EntD
MAGGSAMSAALPGTPVEPVDVARYPVAFAVDFGFGRCFGVGLSTALDADPATLLTLLHAEERPLCHGMRGARSVEFVGGRIASRLARADLPGAAGPTLRGPGGAPTATGGISVSISHSRRFAVALATAEAGCSIGVDIEALDEVGAIPLLAERILSDDERAADHSGAPIAVLRRLSLKEAAYKALFPRCGHIPLRQITVLRPDGGSPGYRITTPVDHGPITGDFRDLDGHVLSVVRVG